MPSDHISNTDYHNHLKSSPYDNGYGIREDYDALKEQKIELQHRCAIYKKGLQNALDWLKENTNMPDDVKDSHLAESIVWERLKINESGLE
tara:strand:+ start:462 stop:734 length:273 start_codon:yes stop_codon:yes gene_type:complete